MSAPPLVATPYGPRYLGITGWRINVLNLDGTITGLPAGDAYTPVARCHKNPEHKGAVPSCTCGHRIVTNFDTAAYFAGHDDFAGDVYTWGSAQSVTLDEAHDTDGPRPRVFLHVAGADPNETPRPPSWDDPAHTHRLARLIVLHVYMRARDAHLAPLVRARYPMPVTVLPGDSFTEILH